MQTEPIEVPSAFPQDLEVKSVVYRYGTVAIFVGPVSGKATFVIRFEHVFGLRILDEGDLLEFWPACSLPSGRLFRVTNGGWFAQEALRAGFLSADTRRDVSKEYLVAGCDDCVNVLALGDPVVAQVDSVEEPSI